MVAIRRATQEDKPSIWRVHTRAIREVCKSHYAQEEIEAWSSFLKPEMYEEAIHSREFLVAEAGGLIVGFGKLNLASREIEAVYVSPDHLRCGVGTELLRALEQLAQGSGIDRLHLSASLNAVPFYEAAGYRAQHKARHHSPSGVELDCVYMVKELTM